MKRSYKYRLSPTKQQEHKLFWTLARCRELYNAALTERRDAYTFHVRQHGSYYDEETRKQLTDELTVNYYQQKRDLPEITMASFVGSETERSQVTRASKDKTAMRASRTRKRAASPSRMIVRCASPRSGVSRSSSIERWRVRLRPPRSSMRRATGT